LQGQPLPPATYEAWLQHNGVAYVALPDVPLDSSSVAERALIRRGVPYLQEVWAGGRWRIYRVLGARAVAEGPGRLVEMGPSSFVLRAYARGNFLVRVHYTPYWSVVHGAASVARAPGGLTQVSVERAGRVEIGTVFSLAAAASAFADGLP
jgi:hypothetical protein